MNACMVVLGFALMLSAGASRGMAAALEHPGQRPIIRGAHIAVIVTQSLAGLLLIAKGFEA